MIYEKVHNINYADGIIATLTGFLSIGITAYEIIYDSYLWHNDKLKYQENLTLREIAYTNERNYL